MSRDPKPLLAYELPASQHATRRQVWLLIFLVVLQLVLWMQATYAPALWQTIRQRWTEHRQAAAHEALLANGRILDQQCLQFSQPPTLIAWEEDPWAATKLLLDKRYVPIRLDGIDNFPYLAGIPRGARLATPAVIATRVDWANSDDRMLLFAHDRRASDGIERLVVVGLDGIWSLATHKGNYAYFDLGPSDQPWTRELQKLIMLHAMALTPANGDALTSGPLTTLEISPPNPHDTPVLDVPLHYSPPSSPGGSPAIRLDDSSRLRIFFGQPDPADPALFTIAYQFNDVPGVIHGKLQADGSVLLLPSTGTLQGSRWSPGGR